MSKNCGQIGNGMIPVKYFHSIKFSFCITQMYLRSYSCHKVEINLATLDFLHITTFQTVVSVRVIHLWFQLAFIIQFKKCFLMIVDHCIL